LIIELWSVRPNPIFCLSLFLFNVFLAEDFQVLLQSDKFVDEFLELQMELRSKVGVQEHRGSDAGLFPNKFLVK